MEFYRLKPWDIDRLTLGQFGRFNQRRNDVIKEQSKNQ